MTTKTLDRNVAPVSTALVPVETPRPAALELTEEQACHADDMHAAGAIAGIMVAILGAGLLLYTVIAFWVFAWPM